MNLNVPEYLKLLTNDSYLPVQKDDVFFRAGQLSDFRQARRIVLATLPFDVSYWLASFAFVYAVFEVWREN